jgi:hypothetical protein
MVGPMTDAEPCRCPSCGHQGTFSNFKSDSYYTASGWDSTATHNVYVVTVYADSFDRSDPDPVDNSVYVRPKPPKLDHLYRRPANRFFNVNRQPPRVIQQPCWSRRRWKSLT